MTLPAANPILARELKERMRSLRVPIILTVYLLLLGLIVFAAERAAAQEVEFGNPFASVTIGRTVFHFLLFFLLMFVCFMVPAFTAGTISGERERQTFHLVQVTLMKPRAIVLGKLGAAMVYLALLIVATIPLVSVSFILGGVTPLDVLRGYAMVLFSGFTIAMLTIGLSANLRRSMASTVLSYGVVLTLTIGTWIGFGLVTFLEQQQNRRNQGVDVGFVEPERKPVWTLVLNPFVGTASAIQGRDTGGRGATPFEGLFSFLTWAQPRGVIVEDFPQPVPLPPKAVPGGVGVRRLRSGEIVVLNGPPGGLALPPQAQQARTPWRAPVWLSTVIGYLMLSGLAYVLALNGVRAPRGAIAAPGGGRKVKRRRSLQQEA